VAGSEPHRLQKGLRWASVWRVLAGAGAALMTGVAFYAVAVEPWTVIETHVSIPIAGLPKPLVGYRILLVSDFEADGPGTRERQVAAIAARARPDLVLVAGDLVDKGIQGEPRVRAYERMAAYLGRLPAPDGVWFAQGHGESASRIHEKDLLRALQAGGVHPLLNEVAYIRKGGASLAVIGVRVHDYAGKGKWTVGSDGVITEGPGNRESYVEYREPGCDRWRDYEFSGRLRFESQHDWVGFLMHSRLGEREDRFYSGIRRDYLPFLGVSAHGTVYSEGSFARSEPMRAGVWHRFRATVATTGAGVRFRARAWREDETEPDGWDFDYLDGTATRIDAGTVGLYGEGPGRKTFTDLRVTAGDGTGVWTEPKGADFLIGLLSGVPAGTPAIVLSHTPDIYEDAAELDVPLTLAGHTQGGQIRLPFIGPLVVDTSVGRDRSAGLSGEDGRYLYVTRGVGTSRLPARLLAPPEATVITLRGAEDD